MLLMNKKSVVQMISKYLSTNLFILFTLFYVNQTLPTNGDWKFIVETGSQWWAGTDNPIFIQLIGTKTQTDKISVSTEQGQLELGKVDEFKIRVSQDIGDLIRITIGMIPNAKHFGDWYVKKIELIDPNGKRYLFRSFIKLTKDEPQRILELPVVDGNSTLIVTQQKSSSKLFLLTVGLILLFTFIAMSAYFANIVYKKWKMNQLRRNRSIVLDGFPQENRDETSLFNNRTRNNAARSSVDDEDKDDDDEIEDDYDVFGSSYNPNSRSNNNNAQRNGNLSEDKPPQYKDLFPNRRHHKKNRQKQRQETTTNNNTSQNNDNNNNNNQQESQSMTQPQPQPQQQNTNTEV